MDLKYLAWITIHLFITIFVGTVVVIYVFNFFRRILRIEWHKGSKYHRMEIKIQKRNTSISFQRRCDAGVSPCLKYKLLRLRVAAIVQAKQT
jgi:hypothetical protein